MNAQFEFNKTSLADLLTNNAVIQLDTKQAKQLLDVIQICALNIHNEQGLNLALTLLESLSEIDCEQNALLALLLDKLIQQIEVYQTQSQDILTANKKLAALMRQHNTKQKDLSHIVPQSIISELVNGKRQLTLRHMQAFAEYFEVPVQYFI
ncbi:helix-turn-helix domain-containing protein [Catenovulum agarivorans]|uniref:helix-turn-helix domain-containing protein n=1 Tax=Catenovulum agarivorans TaxID=1172192 RepID=UPI0002F97434|nr:helix-turn-helix domain-containing protein [Catenovulum agarivorans]